MIPPSNRKGKGKGNIEQILSELHKFSKLSGLKINVEKTEILLLGTATTWDIPKEYRKLIKTEVKILGVMLSINNNRTIILNYDPAIKKMETTIRTWNNRHLSLAGKICILKSLVLSKLIYCMTVLPSPDKTKWKEINNMVFKFLANQGQEKLKRSTLIGPYQDGGFQAPDIELQNKATKISWIKRLINNAGVWRNGILEDIPNVDYRYFLRCNLQWKDLPFTPTKNSMWEEIWMLWCNINFKQKLESTDEMYNQSLWYNSHIKVGGQVVYYPKWAENGIMWVHDILKEDKGYKFLTISEIKVKFKVTLPFMEYLGIITAIPMPWRRMLRKKTQH